jgi:hypothetical protein
MTVPLGPGQKILDATPVLVVTHVFCGLAVAVATEEPANRAPAIAGMIRTFLISISFQTDTDMQKAIQTDLDCSVYGWAYTRNGTQKYPPSNRDGGYRCRAMWGLLGFSQVRTLFADPNFVPFWY